MSNPWDDHRPIANEGLSAGTWALLVLTALTAIGLALNFGLRWINAPLEQYSPENLQMLSRQANERWAALEEQRGDITDLEGTLAAFPKLYGENAATWPQGKADEYQQIQTQLNNRKSAYRQACADYKAFWRDEWRGAPAPNDLPQECPLLIMQ